MTRREALFCLLVFFAAIHPASAAQTPRVRSDQEILIQIEHDWVEAFLRKDIPAIENILADDLIMTYDTGSRGDKAKELRMAAEFDQQVDSVTLDDFTVRIYGNTAVVWFTERTVGPSQGRALAVTLHYMDVFVMRAGRWQCVASQATGVADPK